MAATSLGGMRKPFSRMLSTVERGTKVNEDRDRFLVLVYIAHLKYMLSWNNIAAKFPRLEPCIIWRLRFYNTPIDMAVSDGLHGSFQLHASFFVSLWVVDFHLNFFQLLSRPSFKSP